MQLAIAANAAKLVAPLEELSLSTRLSQLTPGGTQVFATRKWPGVPGPDVAEEEGCRLVVLALNLFHLLSVKEHTRKPTIESSKSVTASSCYCVTKCTCQAAQMQPERPNAGLLFFDRFTRLQILLCESHVADEPCHASTRIRNTTSSTRMFDLLSWRT